ncbi:MAG: hypothetical protein JRJ25_01425 [Deltaproteobacteria bacterium]|nr:hypothetical protein [Deltaproteobacteria bacterium]
MGHDELFEMKAILFMQPQAPYEKTGQFLLTAWLYQFVEQGKGELSFAVSSF